MRTTTPAAHITLAATLFMVTSAEPGDRTTRNRNRLAIEIWNARLDGRDGGCLASERQPAQEWTDTTILQFRVRLLQASSAKRRATSAP